MFRSVFWRLVASHVLVAVLAVTVAGALSYRIFRDHYMSAEQEEVIRIGRSVADLASPLLAGPQARVATLPIAATAGAVVGGRVCIFERATQELLAASAVGAKDELESDPAIHDILAGEVRAERTSVKCEPRQQLKVIVPVNSATGPLGSVMVRAPVEGTEAVLHSVRRLSLLTAVGVAAVAFLLSLVVSRTIASPLKRISLTSARIGDGNFEARVDALPRGEIGELAATVNSMAGRLEALFEELSEEKAHLEGVLGGMAEGVIAIDGGGRVTFANQPARDLLPRSTAEWVGEPLDELSLGEGWVESALRLAREGHEPQPDSTIEGASGATRCKIRTLSGPAGGALILLEDATKEDRLEQMRRSFVANASHQLRTPLTGARGFLEALADGTAATQEARARCVAVALEQLNRMQSLIEKLMDLSRFDAGAVDLEMQPAEVDELLAGAASAFEPQLAEAGVRLEIEAAPELPEIAVDGARIVEALGNLVDNAIRAMPQGGPIRLTAERDGEAVRFTVSDEGPGVDEADLPAVWERFFSRAPSGEGAGGMGLGLAIVREIVHAHGGEVFARNGDAGGAVFGFSVPVRRGGDG